MDQTDRQKWVNLTFVAGAVLAAWVFFKLVQSLAGLWDLEARLSNFDMILQGSSLAVGLITFLIFYFRTGSNQYVHEVIAELSRVSWPENNETVKATFVVMVLVVIAGFILGLMDFATTWLMRVVQKIFI